MRRAVLFAASPRVHSRLENLHQIIRMHASLDIRADDFEHRQANMVTDKRAWLERLEVEAVWPMPMSGKPRELLYDTRTARFGAL